MNTEDRPRRRPRQPVGRVRFADGVERDVYEDRVGRQYVIGSQGEKLFGFWLTITEPRPPGDDEGAALPESIVDEAPWQRAGGMRLDGERHRGRRLATLGDVSFVFGVLGIVTGVLSVPALVLGLYVRSTARQDLAKMKQGTMDPAGELMTQAALLDATVGTALSAIGVVIFVLAVLALCFVLT